MDLTKVVIVATSFAQFLAPHLTPAVSRPLDVPAVRVIAAEPAPGNPPPIHIDGPVFLRPKLVPALPKDMGPEIGSFVLTDRLDVQRDMLTLQLGSQMWDIGVAGDAAFKVLYFTFRQAGRLLIVRVNNIQDLKGNGVNVALDDKTTYNFRVEINYWSFDPIHKSILHIDPVNGTVGPPHDDLLTGDLLNAWKAKSYVFNAGGDDYWALYTTDVDTNTNQLAKTRSLVFFHEAGLSSKVYTLAEGSLAVNQPYALSLANTAVTLVKTADGRLQINSATDSTPRPPVDVALAR